MGGSSEIEGPQKLVCGHSEAVVKNLQSAL